MSEKLAKAGIEPIIAVKERAYGQDIFCTKICGKIIESRLCILILDDAIVDRKNIPNPNVYYEYGLMTALRKHIIPLQKEDLKLAFNIQSYDTIKYTSKNIGAELDRAIKDAIKLTDAQEKEEEHPLLTDKSILRRLEMAGFVSKDQKWFLSDVIGDTNFRGFGHDGKNFYLYLGRIDDESDVQSYMDDLGVVLYRTEKKHRELIEKKEDYQKKITGMQGEEKSEAEVVGISLDPITSWHVGAVRQYQDQIADIDSKLSQMSKIVVGFIVIPDIDTMSIAERAKGIIRDNSRYEVTVGTREQIAIGGASIQFAALTH